VIYFTLPKIEQATGLENLIPKEQSLRRPIQNADTAYRYAYPIWRNLQPKKGGSFFH
jgi:hypothetical protein